jgi:uncharacterized protein (UPF0332 family)
MADIAMQTIYLAKAAESLASAAADHAAGRYNSCANRCYYACFQAAVAALIGADIMPRGMNGEWGHEFVRSEFEGMLIGRRKLYSADLRGEILTLSRLRATGDYEGKHVSRAQSGRALRRARQLVTAVQSEEQSQ